MHPVRKLLPLAGSGCSVDPSLAQRLQTSAIQEIVIRVPWERSPDGDALVGPVGEYVEVVDVDPASGVFYPPVDLDDPNLLAQDGLRPSESNPQFHQQMVYAVAMTTIGHFERALGRVALWAPRRVRPAEGRPDNVQSQFVRRLRIYPHALRDRNAYYSPDKKALLFGYFPVHGERTPTTRRARSSSPACRTTSSPTRARTRCSTAFIRASTSRATPTSTPSTRRSPTSSRCSSTSPIRRAREPDRAGRAAISNSENLLGQLAQQFGRATGRGGGAARCAGRATVNGRGTPQARPARARNDRRPHDPRRHPGRGGVRRVPADLSRAHRGPLPHRHARAPASCPTARSIPISRSRLAEEASRSAQTRAADVHSRARLLPARGHHVRRIPARASSPPMSTSRPDDELRSGSRSSRASASGASIRATFAACRSTR